MVKNFFSYFFLFKHLFYRQWLFIKQQWISYVVRYGVLFPLWFALGSAVFAPLMITNEKNVFLSTTFFCGLLFLQMIIAAFGRAAEFIADCDETQIVRYHIATSNVGVVVGARICFAVFQVMLMTLPALPLAKLLFSSFIDLEGLQLTAFFVSMLFSSSALVSYCFYLSSRYKGIYSFDKGWAYYIDPLLVIGGFSAPWYFMAKALPVASWFFLLNPFLHASEAIRRSVLGDTIFISFTYTWSFLFFITITCTLATLHSLKKKFDTY